jgi:hypothetical protein
MAMQKLQKRKKKTIRSRRRTGASAAPIEKGFDGVLYYFQNEVDRKETIECVKSFIRTAFNKTDAKHILANPDYNFGHSYMGATAYWYTSGQEVNERSTYWHDSLVNRFKGYIDAGKTILKEKALEKKVETNVVSLSPMQRLQIKIGNTIMQDLLDLEDQWMDGEKATIDLYGLFKKHGLTGSATLPVRQVVEGWLLDYEDAYHKRCEQAVEGYSHLKRPVLNHRIKSCQDMLLDLDRIKSAAKAVRKTRVKQPKAADKQVSKVKYLKEDLEFKLVSINPIQMVGKVRLYTFNTKTRMLTEYITQSINGFEFSGTSIKNIDNLNSRTVKLRKPDEFLPLVLNKTPKQIDTEWKKLTTKTSVPNGRLNNDTILLRVMDK